MIKYRDVLTKISVHPLFWVIIVIGIFTARFKELLLLFCIVLIHELGHAFAAAHYNWRIKRIQLLPFGGVAELEEHGNKSLKEELVVVIAGMDSTCLDDAGRLYVVQSWLAECRFILFLHVE